MYLSILFIVAWGAVLAGLLGVKLGRPGSQMITTGFLIISTLLGAVGFYEIGLNRSNVRISIGDWICNGTLSVSWAYQYDYLNISMIITVLIVSSIVHIYSIGYMKEEPHNQRFFSYLSFFTFFMLLLLAGENMVLVFVGWEGDNVCLKWYNDSNRLNNVINYIGLIVLKKQNVIVNKND